jgi:hypothetical protein
MVKSKTGVSVRLYSTLSKPRPSRHLVVMGMQPGALFVGKVPGCHFFLWFAFQGRVSNSKYRFVSF